MPKAEENENERALTTDMSLESLFGVKGKVAFITGGGSGIGAMIATGLARNGAKVYIASRKSTEDFAKELPGCVALQADVANPADVARIVAELTQREGKLHILINNAGTNYSARIGDYKADMFDKVMALNVRALFMLTQELLPLLKKGGSAEYPSRVINISSINGVRAPTAADTYAYSSSKAAVLRLSEHLAGKLAKSHILVNSICPGPFESRMMRGTIKAAGKDNIAGGTALNRFGAPEDMAAPVLYLCGKGGGYVTGATIVVDGGVLVKSSL